MLVRFRDVPTLGQVDQDCHRVFEGLAALHQFCFVRIIREEDLAIRDMLIDLVLSEGVFQVRISAQLVTESKEVSNISRNYWNCETVEKSVAAYR